MEPVERRVFGGFEVRKEGDSPPKLVGYAAKFDIWSDNLGGFREKLSPGAFTKVLKSKPDVRLLTNHDGVALARTTSGTLKLEEDGVGLRVEADLDPANPDVARLQSSMGRRDMDQMSFAFRVEPGGALWDLDAEPAERTVNEVSELFDVSVVTFAAYPSTEASLRSNTEAAIQELEEAKKAAAPPEDPGALPAENIRLRRRVEGR